MMEQYAIYLRKSRKDEEAELRGEGETLARHEKALFELAKHHKIDISEVYKEIVSGETIASRPVMQQLLSEVEQGIWTGVLVMEVERLARGDTIDQGMVAQTFKLSNTKIITPMKIYDPNDEYDEEYFEFGLFMSRREYKTINRRLARGRLASVKEGKYTGSIPPYGYVRKKLEHDKGYTLEPDPECAGVVRLMFDLYTKGELQQDGSRRPMGFSLIAHKLNNLNIPSPNGVSWSSTTINWIIGNPVYIGKTKWKFKPQTKKVVNGQVIIGRRFGTDDEKITAEGMHPAIIDNATFELAQKIRAENDKPPVQRDLSLKNPLAGIVVCGLCGNTMIRRTNGKHVESILCPTKGCTNVSSLVKYLEKGILNALFEWLKDYKINWDLKDDAQDFNYEIPIKQKAIKKLESEIAALTKQLNKVHNSFEQDLYDIDTFVERSKIIKKRINDVKAQRDMLSKELEIEIKKESGRKNIIPKVEKLLDVYECLSTPKEKNDILREVVEKVVYKKEGGGRWHNAWDKFEIIIYPKLPK